MHYGVVLQFAGYLIRLERFKMNNFVLILLASSVCFLGSFHFFYSISFSLVHPYTYSLALPLYSTALCIADKRLSSSLGVHFYCAYFIVQKCCASDLDAFMAYRATQHTHTHTVYVMMSLKCYVTHPKHKFHSIYMCSQLALVWWVFLLSIAFAHFRSGLESHADVMA